MSKDKHTYESLINRPKDWLVWELLHLYETSGIAVRRADRLKKALKEWGDKL